MISQTTGQTQLSAPEQFAGYTGAADRPLSVLLKKNGLHIDIIIDADGQIGSTDAAGINDIVLESALSTIMDCEDLLPLLTARTRFWPMATGWG